MVSGASQDAAAETRAIRNACIAHETVKKYTSNLNGIKKCIIVVLALTLGDRDRNIARYFDANGGLNLVQFTPAIFEQVLVYKHRTTKSSTLSGYRSAMKDLFRLKVIKLPEEYGDGMKQFFFGGVCAIEAKLNIPLTENRDGAHTIELLNIGYITVKIEQAKSRTNQLKLTIRKRQKSVVNSTPPGPPEVSAVTTSTASTAITTTCTSTLPTTTSVTLTPAVTL
ncbi:hypothetical protein ON010_g16265 [Phytophthora cinnamomi]|nr:hypothetical protein ON010_g16265 [Phytophthora cinnamomi]